MGDGAHLHVGAEEAMKAVIGGGEPTQMTDAEFESMIRTATIIPEGDAGFDYDTCSLACARLVLDAYEKYPILQTVPTEARYLKLANGESDWENFYAIDTTLYDVMRKLYDDDSDEYKHVFIGLSGFMWGWAVNAARTVLGLGPVPNPALIEL